MSHLDEGTLHALLDGELTREEARAVEAHLGSCGACRAALAEARDFVRETETLIGDLDEPEAATPRIGGTARRSLPRLGTMGLAASLLLAAGVTYVAYTSGRPGVPRTAPLPANAPTITAAPDTATTAPEVKTATAPSTEQESPDASQAGAGGRAAESSATPTAPAPRDELGANLKRQARAPEPGALADRADRAANERSVDEVDAAAPAAERVEEDGALTKKAAPVTLEVAVASLGGAIRLIDGMTPVRVDTVEGERGLTAEGGVVRVVYQDTLDHPLVLEQSRIGAVPKRAGDRASGLQAAPAPAPAPTPAAPAVARRLEIGLGDTVITRRPDGSVEVRWRDADGFLLTLIGADRDYLLQLIPRVR